MLNQATTRTDSVRDSELGDRRVRIKVNDARAKDRIYYKLEISDLPEF